MPTFSVALTNQERDALEYLAHKAGRSSCGAYVRALIADDLKRYMAQTAPRAPTGNNLPRPTDNAEIPLQCSPLGD